MNLRHPIITIGDFVASLCGSAYSDRARALIWRGEWGGPRHSCVRWKSTCLKGKGLFLAWFLAFFGNCALIHFSGRSDVRNVLDLCVKSWQYFRMHGISLNSVSNWLSCDIGSRSEWGVDAKCTP